MRRVTVRLYRVGGPTHQLVLAYETAGPAERRMIFAETVHQLSERYTLRALSASLVGAFVVGLLVGLGVGVAG